MYACSTLFGPLHMSQLSLNQTIKENPVCIEYHVAWSLSHQCCSLFSSLESSVEFNITRQNVSLEHNDTTWILSQYIYSA